MVVVLYKLSGLDTGLTGQGSLIFMLPLYTVIFECRGHTTDILVCSFFRALSRPFVLLKSIELCLSKLIIPNFDLGKQRELQSQCATLRQETECNEI